MDGKRWFSKTRLAVLLIGVGIVFFSPVGTVTAAYHHMGEIDSGHFLSVFPDKAGTKLDSCNLCHTGGSYTSNGKTVSLGSCQWCHYKTEYGKQSTPANLEATLNPYGLDYLLAGRSPAAVQTIAGLDSDGDGYINADEIAAVRYPGDKADDPTKVPAPYRVFTREQLLQKPQHSQFLLMNASKSDDFYTQYSGVTLEDLLDDLLLGSATGTTAYAPDGFSQYHPLYPDPAPGLYHVFGDYPSASYYYNNVADMALNSAGWCNVRFAVCRREGQRRPHRQSGRPQVALGYQAGWTEPHHGSVDSTEQARRGRAVPGRAAAEAAWPSGSAFHGGQSKRALAV